MISRNELGISKKIKGGGTINWIKEKYYKLAVYVGDICLGYHLERAAPMKRKSRNSDWV